VIHLTRGNEHHGLIHIEHSSLRLARLSHSIFRFKLFLKLNVLKSADCHVAEFVQVEIQGLHLLLQAWII
jgi:hypothetical protein